MLQPLGSINRWDSFRKNRILTAACTFRVFFIFLPREYKKDRRRVCTYDVTLGSVRAITVVVEKQKALRIVSARVCSLRYPACKGHSPCYISMCQSLQYFSTAQFSKKKKKVIVRKGYVLNWTVSVPLCTYDRFYWNKPSLYNTIDSF